ncbi:DUF2335 domain-containing protein [Methylosinus sp. Sm6]|uniref:DUF2335 domain-containing protein n=1 Tax=Methylosinus sp. Sm6 TaxID=2866948 RepID=UPI001C99E7D9|nr:DUF2335 domain-containing protein [Methylosinus sp. Sm6]MBY6239737.1 DUF2335 domain-containing protein [Methylosinus sp. Sm6]
MSEPQAPQDSSSGNQPQVVSAKWVGPLPPPAVLREFEDLLPGGAERLFDQFEKEAEHRRSCEKKQLDAAIADTRLGQFLAGLYAVCAFGVAAFAIYKEANWAAVVIGGTTIVGGIVAFLRQREKE